MGTRADFYVGTGRGAIWLGSVGEDGNPESINKDILNAKTEEEFRAAVKKHLKENSESATQTNQGWPWPWNNSQLTDYSYAFKRNEKRVYAAYFGEAWYPPLTEQRPNVSVNARKLTFPNMEHIKKVAYGPRSGVMIFCRAVAKELDKTKPTRSKA